MKQWIEIARNKAKQSSARFQISAVGFDRRGKYLGTAFNYSRFNRHGGGVHAEMALLHKFGPKIKTILICRVGKAGELRPIDPCIRCKKVLDKMKIKIMTVKGA